MHETIQALFDEAESRYLKPEELTLLNEYVDSLPERLEIYRRIRDQELSLMQQVADQLEQDLPETSIPQLERSLKNTLLVLRQSAMALLLKSTRSSAGTSAELAAAKYRYLQYPGH
ncbi:hypothetical protein [Neosynechococcus sphagnicola]|uniref:hypothetical protein n=1 Tax=Neosynechococcus sphagnicola TaxID=1501145 RepID=UPI00068C7FDD|nr:hypothetical protein [Neosynechococcus sphagnicola]